jgi:hypothetical protein
VSHTGRENLNISQHLLSIELIVDLFDKYKSYNVKGVIRMRKSKKNKQHNGQKKKVQRTNNDLQSIHIKLKIE